MTDVGQLMEWRVLVWREGYRVAGGGQEKGAGGGHALGGRAGAIFHVDIPEREILSNPCTFPVQKGASFHFV